MSDVTKIENHVDDGLKRLLEQWKNKDNMENILRSLLGGVQELEETFFDLRDERLDLSNSNTVGQQLDNYGEIVGQDRNNLDDDFYRVLLNAKIGINVSNGEPERVINTLKLLTSATNVHYKNLRSAEIEMGSDGQINPLTVEFLLKNMNRVVMGGVRMGTMCIYDKDEAFAMAGTNSKTIGKGFGTINDTNVGGKFGQCYNIKNKFSFSGNNTSDSGFGTIKDPLIGGGMSTL
jgi:hypothetical protein